MTLLNYAEAIPWPAPVTTGSTVQTYQDPQGDWWVAKNTVNGGAWRRATDVVRGRVYRSATWTPQAAATLFVFDFATRDDYALFNGTTGIFTAPLAGWYRVISNIAVGSANATATNFGTATVLLLNHAGGGFVGWSQNNSDHYSTASNMIFQSILTDLVPCSANDQLEFQFNTGLGSPTGRVGANLTWCCIEYVGSG